MYKCARPKCCDVVDAILKELKETHEDQYKMPDNSSSKNKLTTIMTQIEEFKEGLQYSEEVRNAVRYGYMYRKEAEDRLDIHYCLHEPSDILLWIANMVIGGIGWDMLKAAVKELYKRIVKQKAKHDPQTNDIFSDESKLKEFYVYIKEFKEHRMSVTEKQFLYIKEEIIADYMGEESGKIFEKEDRLPTNEELMKIFKEALDYAERVLK